MNALLLIAVSLLVQDKVQLQFQPKVGDKLEVTEKMDAKIHLVVNTGGQKVELDVAQRETKRVLMDCQAVDGAQISKATYKVEECFEEKKQPGAPDFEKENKPTHGKTIVAERKDGKVAHQGADGLSEKELQDFNLEEGFASTFPKAPVAIGEAWDVPLETIRKMFHDPTADGKMSLAVKELKTIDGRKCAVLDASIKMKGKADEGIEMTMELKGPVVIWLERGYTMSAKLEGTMSMAGNTPDAKMDGKGPMTVDVAAVIK